MPEYDDLQGIDLFLQMQVQATALLNTAVGGRIYNQSAPDNPASPYLLFDLISAPDRRVAGNKRAYVRATYKVVGVALDTAIPLIAIANLIEQAIPLPTGQTTQVVHGDGTKTVIHGCKRERAHRDVDIVVGKKYFSRGGLFVIIATRMPV